ncbi:MAG: metallophosphoesterase [Agriterribacter sp.]
MKRRNFLRNASLAAAGVAGASNIHATPVAGSKDQSKKPVLTVAHITDVHIRPDENVPKRFKKCLEMVKQHKVDFFLNEVYSCIGNHDPWWSAPSKEDEMYGIPYTVKRLGIPHNYYSFTKKNWHFIILDGNYKGITLGEAQTEWLKEALDKVPQGYFVLLMSHYPVLTVTGTWEGGQHKDHKALKQLFYRHKDKVKVCLSGHQHLLDRA